MVASLNTRRLRRWAGGINNVSDQTDLQFEDKRVPSFLLDAVNIDLDTSGKPSRRRGTQLLLPGAWHSAWSEEGLTTGFAVREGVLNFLRSTGGAVEAVPLAQVGQDRVSYAYLNGEVYWTAPGTAGIASLDGRVREWGLDNPPGVLASATNTGGLDEGTYRVAMTYRDARGEESGATESADVVVSTGGGIFVNVPYLPEGVECAVIYRSAANGDLLYQAGVMFVGTRTFGVGPIGRPLDTQFMERMPTGRIVRQYRGRVYVALDAELSDTVVYSRPLRYGLYKPTEDYLRFGSPIAFMEAVDGGIYVGTQERTYFLSGADPAKFERADADMNGAIPGASMVCQGSEIGEEGIAGRVALWWTRKGYLAVGTAMGAVLFPTKDRYTLADQSEGFMAMRRQDGARRVLSLFRKAGPASGFGARDFADAQVVRNGLVVPPPTSYRAVVQSRVRVADAVDAV